MNRKYVDIADVGGESKFLLRLNVNDNCYELTNKRYMLVSFSVFLLQLQLFISYPCK